MNVYVWTLEKTQISTVDILRYKTEIRFIKLNRIDFKNRDLVLYFK